MTDKIAFIVEPRNHPTLNLVLKAMRSTLSPEWTIWWFHGSEQIPAEVLQPEVLPYVTCKPLDVPNLTIPMYNQLLTSLQFWQPFPAEHLLCFQTDSGPLTKSPFPIESFLEWDYVGAPWSQDLTSKGHWVGNGGLSLRRKSAMLQAIRHVPYRGEPEDVYFSCKCGLNVAPKAIAARFSVEGTKLMRRPWGFHQFFDASFEKDFNYQRINELTKPLGSQKNY